MKKLISAVLVLFSISAFSQTASPAKEIKVNEQRIESRILELATFDSLLKMGYEYSYWGFLNESKKEFLSPPAIKRLHEIKVPTFIVTAEYDMEACKEVAEIMDQQIASATKISINDAGHLMNMDKPDEFNRLISEFIDKVK